MFGDNNTERPGGVNFIDKAKWDAWSDMKGKAMYEAAEEFLDLAEPLMEGSRVGDLDEIKQGFDAEYTNCVKRAQDAGMTMSEIEAATADYLVQLGQPSRPANNPDGSGFSNLLLGLIITALLSAVGVVCAFKFYNRKKSPFVSVTQAEPRDDQLLDASEHN